jgi:glycine/D-amino acid oxidase-like deaminating enzyme
VLEGEHKADVVVVGAGLTGCAAALELARRGLRTVVLEAGTVGGGATAADAGHLCGGPGLFYGEAIARWGREAARLLWEAQRENLARLRSLLAEFADDCGYRAAGGFVLAHEREEGVALAESEDLLREDGFAGEFLDRYMLETRFDVTGFTAGYWAADEGEVDPRRLTQALARFARGLGARLYERTPVLHLELGARGAEAVTARGRVRAGWAFLALGSALGRLAPSLAGHVTALTESGVLMELEAGPRLPSPARLDRGEVCWRAGGRGLSVVTRIGPELPPWSGEALAAERAAGVGGVVQRWTATRAFGPDGLPLIGPVPGHAAAVAGAYGGLGEVAALQAVRWAAGAMAGGRDATPAPLRAARVLAAQQIPQ